MFIILYDGNTRLKKDVKSNFKYKGIEIVKTGDDYYFKLDYPYDLNDSLKIEYQRYEIENLESIEKIIIYVYEDTANINNFNIYRNMNLSILNSNDAAIINLDKYLLDYYFYIEDGYINTNFEAVLVNDKLYQNEKLKHGDEITYLGIEIYYYQDFLYINSFKLEFNISSVSLAGKKYLFKNERVKISNYYKRNYSDINLKKLVVFNPPRRLNDKKIIYQIGPSITMSLAMTSIAGINIYNSYMANGFTLSLIALGLMPLTIMLSGILWPILNRSEENRKYKREYIISKKRYLSYLEEYEKEALKEINRFINDENYYAFNPQNTENKLFYVSKYSDKFLTLNLGHYSKELNFDYEKTIDKDINEKLFSLKNKLSNISNANLFIDLKKDKRISIITSDTRYFLLRILLELASKYSYEDIRVAIYTKDKVVLETVYNLIHLYDGKCRLLYDSDIDFTKLAEFNDSRKTILLSDEKIEIENSNIVVIEIAKNQKDILKYSDIVIEDLGYTSILSSKKEIGFKIDKQNIDFNKYFNYLGNIENNNLSNKVLRFNDFFSLKSDLKEAYLNHDLTLSAQFGCINNELIDFDIHESKDGPHGLIGGSTGSGKSELIISFLLSLILKYPPDYLNIILIDYKGGGIKESLTYKGEVIPHVVASINNLQEGTFERLIVSIDFELKRRQRKFKELSDLSCLSIMSLDDYLSIYKEYNLESMSHLLIVVDEFAELKKENPEVIKELISFSRIGRSLGVHLILATQKPSGVIDDEIWSNSRFKIALKVHSEKDSDDIIKTKEAYYLKYPGEFYLKVDGLTRKGISIYSKTDVNNKDKYEVGILNKQLSYVYKRTIRNKTPELESSRICRMVIDSSKELSLKSKKLDYLKPEEISINHVNNNKDYLYFGIIDDYLNAKKGILKYLKDEDIFIYSNRKNEINNIINELKRTKRKTILISDKKISGEYICDSIDYSDFENLKYLFNKLLKNINEEICILINDINSLISYDENYIDYLIKLTRRKSLTKYNFIVLSSNSNLNFKILNCFKTKLAIEINEKQDISNVFSLKAQEISKSYFLEDVPTSFVPFKIENLVKEKQIVKSFLDKIPDDIYEENLNEDIFIGYLEDSRNKFYIKKDESMLITGFDINYLNKLKKYYKTETIEIEPYEDSLALKKYLNIIWIGSGIYSQRLFYPERNIELDEKGAYLYRSGKGRKIRLINHESNNSSFLYYV